MANDAVPVDMYATGVVDPQATASQKVGGGRYSLRRMLGRGGMGIVWLAFDERLKCEVALKFLPPQIRSDVVAIDDLRRETARSQKLTHPNIIRIHDLYEDENEAFIAMEYVDGSNLATLRVQKTGRVLSWTFLKPLVRQLCEALEFAHSEGIIHRDLKPANLMVDQLGRLKLTDFGIARAITDTMSRNSIGQTNGTLVYMSPQQLEGGLPKIADDIYGLGATLYELLTSKPPFYTGDLLHQVRTVEASSLKQRLRELELVNDIPACVEDLVLACLSKVESQRPQRAKEVAEWLDSSKSPQRRPSTENTRIAQKVWGVWSAMPARKRWCFAGAAAAVAVMASGLLLRHPPNRTGPKQIAAREKAPVVSSKAQQPASPSPSKLKKVESPKTAAEAVTTPTNVVSSLATVEAVKKTSSGGDTNSATGTNKLLALKTSAEAASGKRSGPVSRTAPPKPPTALQLVRQANTHVSERSKDKVVHLLSERTLVAVAPANWRITFYDPKAFYKVVEVQFEDGKMSRFYEPTRPFGFLSPESQKPLDFEKLKIDSSDALRITLGLPAVQEFVVESVEFELERGYGGLPVWRIRLFGATVSEPTKEKALGYAILAADDGKVLKETLSTKVQRAK